MWRISLRREQTLEQAVCRKCGIPRDAGQCADSTQGSGCAQENDICLNYHVCGRG